jgi:hypothetical protein
VGDSRVHAAAKLSRGYRQRTSASHFASLKDTRIMGFC